MSAIEHLRPRVEHLTDERSGEMLSTVLRDTGRAAPRRRAGRVAAAVTVLSVVGGGTAYATGLVPDFVADRFDQLGAGTDSWPDPIGDPYLVAEVRLRNGQVARVWHAVTTDGLCETRDMTGAATEPGDLGAGCSRWTDGAGSDPRRGVFWQVGTAGPAVVYGDFSGVEADVSRVDVSGPGWSRSFRVVAGTFAGEVPAEADGDRIEFVYLDPSGSEIARSRRTVVIESE